MRVEYDPGRDLMYVRFAERGTPAAVTEVIRPGIHADFDTDGQLIGTELLEGRQTVGDGLSFELALPTAV